MCGLLAVVQLFQEWVSQQEGSESGSYSFHNAACHRWSCLYVEILKNYAVKWAKQYYCNRWYHFPVKVTSSALKATTFFLHTFLCVLSPGVPQFWGGSSHLKWSKSRNSLTGTVSRLDLCWFQIYSSWRKKKKKPPESPKREANWKGWRSNHSLAIMQT